MPETVESCRAGTDENDTSLSTTALFRKHEARQKLSMSIVHLVGGEKGGVGKSVVARVLSQYFIDRALPFVGVDADQSHGALLRYYGDYSRPTDLENFASADEIMDRALGADRRVLVDLPAQSARRLKRWMDASDVIPFAKDMQVAFVFWHVSDGGFDSVKELERTLDTFEDTVSYVVVKNLGRSPAFGQLDESPIVERVRASGGRVLLLPALDAETMYKIDRFGSSFWAAVHSADGDLALTPMERRRAARWLEQSYEALETVGDLL